MLGRGLQTHRLLRPTWNHARQLARAQRRCLSSAPTGSPSPPQVAPSSHWYNGYVVPLHAGVEVIAPGQQILKTARQVFDGNKVYSYKPGSQAPGIEPEVAFVGRSNVGKSSLVNALLGLRRARVARVSKKAGCTKMMYYYGLNRKMTLVDMPGYGGASRVSWNAEARDYLEGRAPLCMSYVLVDSRHDPFDTDLFMMEKLNKHRVPFTIVLTKADKVNQAQVSHLVDVLNREIGCLPCAQGTVHLVSAKKGLGIDALRVSAWTVAHLATIAAAKRAH